MTSQEFIIWLKGFIEGAHSYNITPAQWDLLKEKIKEVKDTNTNNILIDAEEQYYKQLNESNDR